MKSKSFEGMACSIAGVLEAIGDRWAVLILRDLSLGLEAGTRICAARRT